jgi:hypothetical protein
VAGHLTGGLPQAGFQSLLVNLFFMSRIPPRVLALTASALLASGAIASGASAVTTTPTTSTTSTTTNPTPTPTPKPTPAKAQVRLYLSDAFFVSQNPVTVPGRTVHVVGVVRPYVPGQWVLVRSYLGRHLFKTDRLRLKPNSKHTYGAFTEKVKSPGVGTLTVTVAHDRDAAMLGFLSRRTYSVLDPHAGFGSTGRFVQLIQNQLSDLHFYIPRTGVYDSGTGLAIDAYHRLRGWGTSQTLDGRTISALLNGQGSFTVRYPRHGTHAEGDLTHQLLALINGSKVYWIFPISSGKPSTPTVLGNFRVYSRVPGYLPDGMYYSSFFTGGYAIHGYDPAPDYPASHGCMRLPIQDAIAAYHWLNYGDAVDVYYR